MKSPDAPPTCPETCYAAMAPLVEGAGADRLQEARAVAARNVVFVQPTAMVNGTFGGRPTRRAFADLRTPQAFGTQPNIVQLSADTPPQSDPAAHSPGRALPTVWDGEPGAHAPNNEPW